MLYINADGNYQQILLMILLYIIINFLFHFIPKIKVCRCFTHFTDLFINFICLDVMDIGPITFTVHFYYLISTQNFRNKSNIFMLLQLTHQLLLYKNI